MSLKNFQVIWQPCMQRRCVLHAVTPSTASERLLRPVIAKLQDRT